MNSNSPLTCAGEARRRPSLALGTGLLLLITLLTFSARAQTPTLTVDRPIYATGQDIVATFANGPGNATDWIGIYPEGVTPGGGTGSTLWFYVDGTRNGDLGLVEGTVTFPKGLAVAGKWVAYLLANDGYEVLASRTFEVKTEGAEPQVWAAHSTYAAGEDIAISFRNGPGNAKDWIGIYPEGTVPGSVDSTRWLYVDNTQGGNTGLREGSVLFGGGLNLAGNWDVFLLLNNGYTVLAQTTIAVVDPTATRVRTDQRLYEVGKPIQVSFQNGPGNATDWIGVYKQGETPGDVDSTLWFYVDGTRTGTTGLAEGAVTFAAGLASPGAYAVHLLLDDGYDILATETFTVTPPAPTRARLLSVSPSDQATGLPPFVQYEAVITNGTTKVVPASVQLQLDGQTVIPQAVDEGTRLIVRYQNPVMFPALSSHTYHLTFADDATAPNLSTNDVTVQVGEYRNIVLPAPLYFENFDAVPEGQLPAGWTEKSYTEVLNPEFDLGNLDSASYATWTVVAASRFEGRFVTYSNPDAPVGEQEDYQRVLTPNPLNVVNGQWLNGPLAQGRFLFGNSGYRRGQSQVLYVFTPDFDLSGKTDIHVAFHSLWEQNQDSFAALEYSTDRGANWLPVLYLMATGDLVTDQGQTDAVASLTKVEADQARYIDPDSGEEKGGFYGAFIGAAITPDLAPYISGRIDDNPVESKRVELFRLPAADHQATVRFRFAHAGVDSWYWGLDNFGLYSIPSTPGERPTLTITRNGSEVTLTWPASAQGFKLESTPSLGQPDWNEVPGVSGNSVTIPATALAAYYRLKK